MAPGPGCVYDLKSGGRPAGLTPVDLMGRISKVSGLLFALPLLFTPSYASSPLSLDQVVSLLEAGVGEPIILRQVSGSGASFTIGVEEILTLNRAGASDDLLATLDDLTSPAEVPPEEAEETGEAGPGEPSFRIFKEITDDGREVMHITNLDDSGRRMGKPVEKNALAAINAYESRDDQGEYEASRAGAEPPPIIVNVFPPPAESGQEASPASGAGYRDPYHARFVTGRLPGYYSPYYRMRYPRGVPSPPGSYSHFKYYHSETKVGHTSLYNGTLQYRRMHQLGVHPRTRLHALPVPFVTAGAGALNRMRTGIGADR
jgi:hypothetical protein